MHMTCHHCAAAMMRDLDHEKEHPSATAEKSERWII
jgi:hypothetical protein